MDKLYGLISDPTRMHQTLENLPKEETYRPFYYLDLSCFSSVNSLQMCVFLSFVQQIWIGITIIVLQNLPS